MTLRALIARTWAKEKAKGRAEACKRLKLEEAFDIDEATRSVNREHFQALQEAMNKQKDLMHQAEVAVAEHEAQNAQPVNADLNDAMDHIAQPNPLYPPLPPEEQFALEEDEPEQVD